MPSGYRPVLWSSLLGFDTKIPLIGWPQSAAVMASRARSSPVATPAVTAITVVECEERDGGRMGRLRATTTTVTVSSGATFRWGTSPVMISSPGRGVKPCVETGAGRFEILGCTFGGDDGKEGVKPRRCSGDRGVGGEREGSGVALEDRDHNLAGTGVSGAQFAQGLADAPISSEDVGR